MAKTPRVRYLKYRSLDRLRHSKALSSWLDEVAQGFARGKDEAFEGLTRPGSAVSVAEAAQEA